MEDRWLSVDEIGDYLGVQRDAANYLYANLKDELLSIGIHSGRVTGTDTPKTTLKKSYDFQSILTLFSPISKEETFLYYRYPNISRLEEKLSRFFDHDTLAISLISRIYHEFSHGVFERSILPLDVPEMKTTANFILQKIKEKDQDQYSALLQSIGVEEEVSIESPVLTQVPV